MTDIVRFANPHLFWLLALIPLMVGYYLYRTRQGRAAIHVSSIDGVSGNVKTYRYWLRHTPLVLRCLAVGLITVCLARPQRSESHSQTDAEGIDIVISLDISSSMLARDFTPDRLEAAKDVASKFILDRPYDRIGLVVFAGESFTQSPLTTDHLSLINLMQQVHSGMIDDGTAIGNGLATAVNRLKESNSPGKVVILLTDGVNNSGQIDPRSAAQIAKEYGIRVYTVGVGTQGVAPYPTLNPWGGVSFTQQKVEIDEAMLTDISKQTGGRYFRATDNTKLAEIYAEIDQLEKAKVEIESFTRYTEAYHPFLLLALLLGVCELLCRYLFLRQIP